MPRRAKGPRLYLKERAGREAVWIIRDGTTERSTGCAPDGLGDAEKQLAAYIAEKWTPQAAAGIRNRRDPSQVGVDEVLALYTMEHAPKLKADPASTAGFIGHLNGWWQGKMLSEVRRSTCQAYTAHRSSQPIRHGATGRMASDQTARRELETLNAAIGYWHGEDALTTRPKVWLPEKAESPRDALTRSQAAALLRAAMGWRRVGDAYGPPQPGKPWPARWIRDNRTTIANRRHMRRFILIGLYTGSRSGVIKAMLWHESPTNAWADLEKGMVFRRGKTERETANKRRPVVKLPRRLLAHMRRWATMDAKDIRKPNSVIHFGGEPLQKVRRGFAGCVADAGLSDEITPHYLRHTAATWLMQRGVSIWDAAAYTGMTASVLEKHYGHHQPGYQERARRAL